MDELSIPSEEADDELVLLFEVFDKVPLVLDFFTLFYLKIFVVVVFFQRS